MPKTWLVLPVVGVLFACGAAGGEDVFEKKARQVRAAIGPDFEVAVEKPFVVVSDQSEKDFRRSCKHTIGWAVRLLKKDFFDESPPQPLVIYLFDGEESYHKHAEKLFGDKPDTPFGYYLRSHGALIMNIATGGGTLVHEIVHPFMEANFPSCPAWFDEGMGSLYEACRERSGHIEGTLNWRLRGLKEGISNGEFVPLEKLLATTSAEFYDDPTGMHYAEARYLLYYVQQKGKLREYYKRFTARAKEDPSGVQTLCEVMGFKSIGQLEADWLSFVGKLSK